jgi:hypothetical protein
MLGPAELNHARTILIAAVAAQRTATQVMATVIRQVSMLPPMLEVIGPCHDG